MFTHRIDIDTELCLIERRHAEELFGLVVKNYDHLREWESWLKDEPRIEDTHSFIQRNLKQYADNAGFEIMIMYKGQIAGQIGYNYLDWNDRKTEIGYWLGASFQRMGLVTRSCRALINHAFGELKMNRVEIRCGVGNNRSRMVPERLGFTQEGVLRKAERLHDNFIDLVVYGLLASEWKIEAQS
jgi:ribosomal-protein-serine acetyltransferase